MLVVSDSSTLILLAKSGLLDAALSYFDGMTIPKAVEREVVEEGVKHGLEDALLVRERISRGKIRVMGAMKKAAGLKKEYGLHQGEAEAIAAYFHLKADLLGIDDGKAINACRVLAVRFFTALSLLIHLSQTLALTQDDALAMLEALERHGRYAEEEIAMAAKEIGGATK